MHRLIAKYMVLNILLAAAVCAQDTAPPAASQPSLTIYNQNFAVVRQNVPLDLKAGTTQVHFADATGQIEPDSVILRDPGGRPLQVLEQNYRNDPISQQLLLSLFEGKTIDFRYNDKIIKGKIIRGGYVPGGSYTQPIIEVDGLLQFQLPGEPLFPALGNDTILKPTLDWSLQTDHDIHSTGELSYVTGGFNWHADYNFVIPPKGDVADLVGWITMSNQSGKTFENARIMLMAGDVNKIVTNQNGLRNYGQLTMLASGVVGGAAVTEKKFDEFHLYTLEHSTTLRDQQSKQVEFVRAAGIKSQRLYVYDGLDYSSNYYGSGLLTNQSYGNASNKKVWVMQEFKNSRANNLGMPLPAGRIRFYRRDEDNGSLQFIGENQIDHTPTDETIRVYTGNAFDIVGERTQTNFHYDSQADWIDESFEIKVRNHGKTPVTVRVVEHLYRWTNWEIRSKSDEFKKLDAQKIEFPVTIPADGEKIVTYTAHYSW